MKTKVSRITSGLSFRLSNDGNQNNNIPSLIKKTQDSCVTLNSKIIVPRHEVLECEERKCETSHGRIRMSDQFLIKTERHFY